MRSFRVISLMRVFVVCAVLMSGFLIQPTVARAQVCNAGDANACRRQGQLCTWDDHVEECSRIRECIDAGAKEDCLRVNKAAGVNLKCYWDEEAEQCDDFEDCYDVDTRDQCDFFDSLDKYVCGWSPDPEISCYIIEDCTTADEEESCGRANRAGMKCEWKNEKCVSSVAPDKKVYQSCTEEAAQEPAFCHEASQQADLDCEWDNAANKCIDVVTTEDVFDSGIRDLRVKVKELNVARSTNIPRFIGLAIQSVLGIIGSIALAMIVYGGILWMTAAGNSERTRKAAQILLWAALGIVMILISYLVVQFVFEPFATDAVKIR